MGYCLQLAASIERVFRSLDADGNGVLDRDELRAGFAAMVWSAPALTVQAEMVFIAHAAVATSTSTLPGRG